MTTCTIETGLLRKKPCGQVSVAKCINCEQPLCMQHAVAQLSEMGKKTGKFMCPECVAAAKDHAKNMAAVARKQEERKAQAIQKDLIAATTAAAAKPAAPRPAAAPAQPVPAKEPETLDALEFTPKDGKFGYTPKKDEPGFKGD